MLDLQGKTAIITGAARGIGKQIALALARSGAGIIGLDLLADELKATVQELQALGVEAEGQTLDICDLGAVEAFAKEAFGRYKHLDILVNNAGITRDNLILRMSGDDWGKVLAVNLTGTFNCLKAVGRYMIKQKGGRIVNIASVVGITGNPGQANYTASKGGVIALTKTAAREMASRGITVNAVAPGYIRTEMTEALSDEVKKEISGRIPLGRLGEPTDIARAVLFLVSDLAAYVTGQVVTVDGGLTMA